MWRDIVAVCGFVLIASAAYAQESPGDRGAGRAFAQRICAACHAVRPGETQSPNADTPSFQSIAQLPGVTALRLKVALRTVHERMPDLVLSPRETDDVIAYILGLSAK